MPVVYQLLPRVQLAGAPRRKTGREKTNREEASSLLDMYKILKCDFHSRNTKDTLSKWYSLSREQF